MVRPDPTRPDPTRPDPTRDPAGPPRHAPGDLPCSDLPFGDLPCGDLPCGDLPCGDLPCGDLPCGDLPCGDLPCGDLPCGDLPCGDLPCGDLPALGWVYVTPLSIVPGFVLSLPFVQAARLLKVVAERGPWGSRVHGGSCCTGMGLPCGDLPCGDLPCGDLPCGDLPCGDLPCGDLPCGDLPCGDLPCGDLPIICPVVQLDTLFPDRRVFTHLSRYLLHPANYLWDRITRLYHGHLAHHSLTVGLQIRAFEETEEDLMVNVFECATNIARVLPPVMPTDQWRQTATSVTEEALLGVRGRSIGALVVSLNPMHGAKLRDRYMLGKPLDGSTVSVFSVSGEGEEKQDDLLQYELAVTEMWLLAFCDVLLVTDTSTFGYVAAGVAGLTPYTMNVAKWKHSDWRSNGRLACMLGSSEPCYVHKVEEQVLCPGEPEKRPLENIPQTRACHATGVGLTTNLPPLPLPSQHDGLGGAQQALPAAAAADSAAGMGAGSATAERGGQEGEGRGPSAPSATATTTTAATSATAATAAPAYCATMASLRDLAFDHEGRPVQVYMRQPPGFDDGSGRVCRLKKSIYGLKQAPRQWYLKFDEALMDFGFERSECDPALYHLVRDEGMLSLYLYVDDILLMSSSMVLLDEVKGLLSSRFRMKDLGEAKYYLGVQIERDESGILIHQERYTMVFPLRSKGQVVDVLIPWICTVRLQRRKRFRMDLRVLRLHSDKGGELSSDLLRDFCHGDGILQSFTLPTPPRKMGLLRAALV
ncbi:unnamed protein product [Closterium sp. NIES-54]